MRWGDLRRSKVSRISETTAARDGRSRRGVALVSHSMETRSMLSTNRGSDQRRSRCLGGVASPVRVPCLAVFQTIMLVTYAAETPHGG
jgi:hypothetical protein